jgi:hypothetical protein
MGKGSPADRPAALGWPRQRFRSYFTLAAFLRRRYGEGTTVRDWIYRDGEGREAFRVLRIDYRGPDGSMAKTYRPCHRCADGRWQFGRPEGLLPLYNLAAILTAPPQGIVTVLEGEKCADLAASIGLPHATTSAHGAQSPQLTDWSPLAGRPVAIIRDEGGRGGEYAAKVTAILDALTPPADARILQLPGLSNGEDIEQWIAAQRAAGHLDCHILGGLLRLIDSAIR